MGLIFMKRGHHEEGWLRGKKGDSLTKWLRGHE